MNTQAGSYPAPTNVRGAPYPQINPDGSVTFRLEAPGARRVRIQPGGMDNGLGSEPYEMTRDTDGGWTGTIPPGIPGFHYYWFLVDGLAVNDPGSETFFGYSHQTGGVELPEADEVAAYYRPQNVPHGDVRIRASTPTAASRSGWRHPVPAAFNARVGLLWFGAGTGEPREWGITQRRMKELDEAGIDYVLLGDARRRPRMVDMAPVPERVRDPSFQVIPQPEERPNGVL